MMAVPIEIVLEEGSYQKAYNAILQLAVEAERAGQAIKEFSAAVEAIRARYHPIVWWILSVFICKRKDRH